MYYHKNMMRLNYKTSYLLMTTYITSIILSYFSLQDMVCLHPKTSLKEIFCYSTEVFFIVFWRVYDSKHFKMLFLVWFSGVSAFNRLCGLKSIFSSIVKVQTLQLMEYKYFFLLLNCYNEVEMFLENRSPFWKTGAFFNFK